MGASADTAAVERWLSSRQADASPDAKLAPGEVVGGWRVQAFLGAGLSAEVYRVTNVRFGQEGALKLLVDGTRGLRERFLAEADAIRFLSMRALPRYMDSGELGGMPFYVMEYLRPLPEQMPRGDVPRFMIRVAKAVQALHEAGYIHRDLKPGNVMRRAGGEPVLIDLGLIKKRGIGVADSIVRHGRGISLVDGKPVGVGTLDYAAPEQLLKGESSVQSDIFALGKMLFEMYGGRPPRNARPVIRRATQERSADRFESAAAFAAALRRRNRPRVALALAAAALAIFAALFPALRPRLAELAMRLLNPPKPEPALVQRPDEDEAAYLARILPLAGNGDAQAQIAVGEAYFYGRGTATNRAEAVRWYRLAAEAGEPDAMASLGLCLFRGWGCEKDVGEAARWWELAAEKGCLGAMSDLAFCYLHGFGVAKDAEKGFQWAMRAAERGHAQAQTTVGECYLEGRGVERDVGSGERWLYRAARQDNTRAKMLLKAW